jgi:hypothetical protein
VITPTLGPWEAWKVVVRYDLTALLVGTAMGWLGYRAGKNVPPIVIQLPGDRP